MNRDDALMVLSNNQDDPFFGETSSSSGEDIEVFMELKLIPPVPWFVSREAYHYVTATCDSFLIALFKDSRPFDKYWPELEKFIPILLGRLTPDATLELFKTYPSACRSYLTSGKVTTGKKSERVFDIHYPGAREYFSHIMYVCRQFQAGQPADMEKYIKDLDVYAVAAVLDIIDAQIDEDKIMSHVIHDEVSPDVRDRACKVWEKLFRDCRDKTTRLYEITRYTARIPDMFSPKEYKRLTDDVLRVMANPQARTP